MLGDYAWLAVGVPIHPNGIQVKATCRPVTFFHTDLGKPFLYGPRFVQGGIVMLKFEAQNHLESYCIVLRFSFTETKWPNPNYEKQPHNHYSSSTKLYSWHDAFGHLAFSLQLPNPDSSCQMVKRDSLLQKTHFHCSNGGKLYTTPATAWHCA